MTTSLPVHGTLGTAAPYPVWLRRWARGLLGRYSLGLVTLSCALGADSAEMPANLALTARASAFETYQGMTADQANDGRMDTRWSGIPGHNTGGWYELDWDQPVRLSEVVVFQHDRYVKEMDLQVWEDETRTWVTLQHFGDPNSRLPRVVVCRFKTRTTTRMRLANITNGPSFTEVQVFEHAFSHPPVVNLASDAAGNFIGMVSDEWGSAPLAGAEVALRGHAKSGPWQATVRSETTGLFFAPVPLGLTGQVQVTAALPEPAAGTDSLKAGLQTSNSLKAGQRTMQTNFDGAGFQYGLTPESLRRRKSRLDGQWRFAPDPPADFWRPEFKDETWSEIRVPSHFMMEGFQSLEGIGGYRKHFQAPPGSGRVKLRFEGVYSGAEVWVNGQRLAYHEGGALPFELDITEDVRGHDNVLAVRVTQHTVVSDELDKMSEYADFPLAGIMRPVFLFRVPPAHIGKLAVSEFFDEQYRDVRIEGQIAVLNESPLPLNQAQLSFRLLDSAGKAVPLETEPVSVQAGSWARGDVRVSLPVKAPRHWEAEHPNLYTLELTLKAKGRVLDTLAQQIGFRQTEIRAGRLLINGEPVKIRGTCHHDSHPLRGRAVDDALERRDLELMKEANLNALRTSHYPPLPSLLDLADQLGIYVEDEGSFCWVGVADDLRLTPRILQLNAELLARDRNHPSVFMWSVCNESAFGTGFERSHQWLRAADTSRPDGGSYDRGSLEILARHNPITIADITELEKMSKPVLWDECWCIFQGIWGDVGEMWLDPGIRDYYGEPLSAIYARMMGSQRIAGTQIWAWSDDIFCMPHRGLEYGRQVTRSHFIENEYRLPNRGLVGDAPWGVVDGWRRRKPEFWITKKLHSPVKFKEGPLPIPARGEPIRVTVENQYDFTDLAELNFSWRIGDEHGIARTLLPPHKSGQIEIRPHRVPREGAVLVLEAHDRVGRLVDACELPFGQMPAVLASQHYPALRRPGPGPLGVARENYLSGPGIRVVGDGFELGFDQATGELRRGVVFGQALLLELPHLHVLPSATPFNPLPNPLTWELQNLDVKADGANMRVRIGGKYDRFEGGYDLLITPGGAITAHASFKYSGDKLLAREIGLAFSVPKDCDLVRWQRRAEWSFYPADHIGRPAGETRAFAVHPNVLPPTWSWSADNSPMGCNDFRSTKRHVDWASIAYPGGPGVWVQSDGAQHLRAMVASDRITVHVNDWYGGTHAGLWEWTSNYSEGRSLTPGQTIEATVHLQLGRLK